MNQKIKILFVHHFPGMGGATMSLFYIVEKLDPSIYDISVLFLGEEGDGIRYFKERGFKVITLSGIPIYPHAYGARLSFISRKPFKPFTLAWQVYCAVPNLVKWFNNNPFDIVHLNTSLLLPFGKAAHLAGIKVVWHIRESLYAGFLGIRKTLIRNWIKKYSDKIFSISTFEAKRLGKSDKIAVVYNYIDFQKFDSDLSGESIREEFGLLPLDYIVCNLGGTVHSKGAEIYLKAAALLTDKKIGIKFFLVGDKQTVKQLEGNLKIKYYLKKWMGLKVDQGYLISLLIKKYRLEERVILTGLRPDIPEILTASDVLAWTATVPHFARPIIEASAMKKPVIAANFPNTHEAMIAEKTGLTFKPGSASDLAEKIQKLYHDRALGKKMGDAGKRFALEKFNADKNFSAIENAYLALLQDRS